MGFARSERSLQLLGQTLTPNYLETSRKGETTHTDTALPWLLKRKVHNLTSSVLQTSVSSLALDLGAAAPYKSASRQTSMLHQYVSQGLIEIAVLVNV